MQSQERAMYSNLALSLAFMSDRIDSTPSQFNAPVTQIRRSRSKLIIPPTLRTAQSFASLRAEASTATQHADSSYAPSRSHTPPQSQPPSTLQSSASSMSGVDIGDGGADSGGILVQELDADVDTIDGDEGNASGHMENRAGEEESKKLLRESLRRTLTQQTHGSLV